MPANGPANAQGLSSTFDSRPHRHNFRHPYQLPKHLDELKEKWCSHCERSHAQGQCQYLMVDRMMKDGLKERDTLTERLVKEAWQVELQRRLGSSGVVDNLGEFHFGSTGDNEASTGQEQQQTDSGVSQFTEGPFEIADSEDESDYEYNPDVDDESVSGASESSPAPAPEATQTQKRSETGNNKDFEESLCLLVLSSTVFVLIFGACVMYLVTKFGVRLGLAVYAV